MNITDEKGYVLTLKCPVSIDCKRFYQKHKKGDWLCFRHDAEAIAYKTNTKSFKKTTEFLKKGRIIKTVIEPIGCPKCQALIHHVNSPIFKMFSGAVKTKKRGNLENYCFDCDIYFGNSGEIGKVGMDVEIILYKFIYYLLTVIVTHIVVKVNE